MSIQPAPVPSAPTLGPADEHVTGGTNGPGARTAAPPNRDHTQRAAARR